MVAARPQLAPGCPYGLVIFDFDGTLVDSAGWFAGVINGVARRYRFRPLRPGELEGLRDRDVGALLRHLDVARWKLPFIARQMRKLASRDRDQIKLFDGVGRVLRMLHAVGIRIAVVSSNSRNNVEHALGPELVALVDHFACGASVFGKAKLFRRVLRAANAAPGTVLAVGDETRDMDAACMVGIAFGAVAWGYANAATLAARQPRFLFARPDDLVAKLASYAVDQGNSGAARSQPA